jgi:DNA (cytosine-5)-methyltransferase 1
VDDYETWITGGVVPTLNAFDNGDVRTTVIIFYGNRVDDVRLQGAVINTLQARMGTGGNNMPMVAKETNVRRLTPVECERLQGFPDDWTAGQSDSTRYKQMGNAVAVPVVEWIVQGIVDVAKVS